MHDRTFPPPAGPIPAIGACPGVRDQPSLAWRVEHACAAAWPARIVHARDGWTIGISGGGSRRANSASAATDGAGIDRGVIAAIVAAYDAAGQEPIIRVTDLVAVPDALLDMAGFGPAEGRTRTLLRALHESPRTAPPAATTIVIDPAPIPAWEAARAALLPAGTADDHHHVPMRVAGPAAFARVTVNGATASVGYVAITAGVAVIEAVATDPAQRRRGHAATLVTALLEQARRHGAAVAALQVAEDNAPARALYDRLGFATDLFGYRYRRAPRATPLPTAARRA